MFQVVLKPLICAKLQMDPTNAIGFRNYLTRRIWGHVEYSKSRGLVDEGKWRLSLTLPIPISKALETVIRDQQVSAGAGHAADSFIPVHNWEYNTPTADHVPMLPPLRDDDDPEVENLRYWEITRETMWAGQNAVADEVAEILRCMTSCMEIATTEGDLALCDRDAMLVAVLRHMRQRMRLPKLASEHLGPIYHGRLDKREEALVQKWAAAVMAAVPLDDDDQDWDEENGMIGI